MNISVQISYYPLSNNFTQVISEFLELLAQNNIHAEVGQMSTVILLKKTLYPFLERYPSIFTLTISNACNSCMS